MPLTWHWNQPYCSYLLQISSRGIPRSKVQTRISSSRQASNNPSQEEEEEEEVVVEDAVLNWENPSCGWRNIRYERPPNGPNRGRLTHCTIIGAQQAIWKVLSGISNTISNTGHYGYVFIIYTTTQWISLGNTTQVVPPTNIGAYGVGDQTARYAYEVLKTTFAAYKRHKDATVRMILYIFGTVVFLNLQNIHGFVVGHTSLELLAYLEQTYVPGKK